jgi:hypothetical protein
MKTKILYHLFVTKPNGTQYEQFLKPCELHLLSKILEDNEEAKIAKHKVAIKFYESIFGKN